LAIAVLHLNGAESEKIAPAGHEVFTDEAAVAEGSAGKSDETEAWPGSHQKRKKQSSNQSSESSEPGKLESCESKF
jgi:hypothetical protein